MSPGKERSLPAWRRVLTLLLIPPACLAAWYLGMVVAGLTPRPAYTALPTINGLQADPKALDLGEVWETPKHTVVVPIKNAGGESRTITDFGTACDCIAVEPRTPTLTPGQTSEVRVTLDLTHRLSYQHGLARRPLSVKLSPVFQGDFTATPGWEMRGVVKSRVTLETVRLAFGDKCTQGGPPASRKIRVRVHEPLERLEASADPDAAFVRVEPIADTLRQYSVIVTPNPDLPVGSFRFDVPIQAVTADGTAHPCASIEVTGEMQPSVRVLPRMVLLGEHQVPSQSEADITVRLPHGGWTVHRIETDSLDTVVTKKEVEPDGGVRYRVTQQINRPGDNVSRVQFLVRPAAGPGEVVTAEVRYHGLTEKR